MSFGQEVDSTQASDVLAFGEVHAKEREAEPREVRAAAKGSDHDVGKLARLLHLLDRLLPDDGLVREHMIEHAAERVVRLGIGGCTLHGLGDRKA